MEENAGNSFIRSRDQTSNKDGSGTDSEESEDGSQLSEGKCWGRLKSGCLSLKERWFTVEAVLLLKLAIPMVSIDQNGHFVR